MKHCRLWNTRSPAFAGDDHLVDGNNVLLITFGTTPNGHGDDSGSRWSIYPKGHGVIMNKALGLLALVSIIALQAGTANAGCAPGTFVKHQNGEDFCRITSDGPGQPYTAGPQAQTAGKWWASPAAKARVAAELANRRRLHFH